MPEIYQIIIVALFAAFIILFLGKTGLRTKIRDWFDMKGVSIFADMLECDFCLSFWVCLCLACGLAVFGYEIYVVATAICASPITLFLL